MDGAEGIRESECVGLWASTGYDLVRAQHLFSELLGWSSGVEELGLNVHLVSDLKLRWRSSSIISRALVSALCFADVVLEVLVQGFALHAADEHARAVTAEAIEVYRAEASTVDGRIAQLAAAAAQGDRTVAPSFAARSASVAC